MDPELKHFAAKLSQLALSERELGIRILWYLDHRSPDFECAPSFLADQMRALALTGEINRTRFAANVRADPRTNSTRSGAVRLKLGARAGLAETNIGLLGVLPLPDSNAVLPLELFANARGYIQKVVKQMNASYEISLFDCSAVMARRLLETLIIEVYEHLGRADELKGSDGNFMMFAGLLSHVEKETNLNLGRNTLQGLRDFKGLGDRSAHDRRFNARQPDIDRVQSGLRSASEDLLHLAGQA